MTYRELVDAIIIQNAINVPLFVLYPKGHPKYTESRLIDIFLRMTVAKNIGDHGKIRIRKICRRTYWDCVLETL